MTLPAGGATAALTPETQQSFAEAAGTLLYFVSPLSWYYGAVALPYALEGALTLGVVALLWRAAEERRPGAAAGAAAVLAVAGGVRQTTTSHHLSNKTEQALVRLSLSLVTRA